MYMEEQTPNASPTFRPTRMSSDLSKKNIIDRLDEYIDKIQKPDEIEVAVESTRRARSRQCMARIKQGWEKTTKLINKKRGSTGMPLMSL